MELASRLDCLALRTPGSSCLLLLSSELTSPYHHAQLFVHGFYGLNPDFRIVKANTMSTELSPKPMGGLQSLFLHPQQQTQAL